MNYWQIASDSYGRDYSGICLRYGIACAGGESPIRFRTGDRVILKRGMQEILAVGEVVERNGCRGGLRDKGWLYDFDGRDLSGYCYVDWRRPAEAMKASGLSRSTIDEVHKQELRDLADRVIRDAPLVPAEPEPAEPEILYRSEVLEFMVEEGLRPSSVEDLTKAVNRICLLADYYYKAKHFRCEDILEHETRSFLIVPLLLALGWAEQQLKIGFGCRAGKIDIACFSRRYRNPAPERKPNLEDVTLLIESRGFASGLDYAPAQAMAYAEEFPSCQAVVVSNGYCYKAYRRNAAGKFSEQAYAYLNLLRPTRRYPVDPQNVAGALEVLKLLLPSGGQV